MPYPVVLFSADGEQFNTYRNDNQQLPYGTQLVMQDGRKYRFAQAGATLLVVGDCLTSSAAVSTAVDLTAVASAAASRTPSATTGAAAIAANFYREGYAGVSVTPDGGSNYVIGSHLANAGSAALILNLAPGFALLAAWTTTSRVDLILNSYKAVIQSAATTLTAALCGVAVRALAANTSASALSHGWVQTRGIGSVLTSGTNVVGLNATIPLGTGGAAGPSATDTASVVGRVQRVAASGAWSDVYITIDG